MGDDDMPRFSDAALAELAEDFNQHKLDFVRHERAEAEKFGWILAAQERNTEALGELTAQVTQLVVDTQDLVKLQRDFRGAARIGNGVQKVLLWCLKWGVIGGATATFIAWVIEQANQPPVN